MTSRPAPPHLGVYGTVTQVSGPLKVLQDGAGTALPASTAGTLTLSVNQRVACLVMPDRRLMVLGPEVRP